MKAHLIAFGVLIVAVSQHAIAVTDEVKLIAANDGQMMAAKATARRTLDQFLAIHANPPFDVSAVGVKVTFTHNDVTELMWVTPFRRTTNGFEGVLKNQPRDIPAMQWGQQVTFSKEQIADWGYTQRGKTYGHFTTCVLFERNATSDALKEKKDRGFVCDRTGREISPNAR